MSETLARARPPGRAGDSGTAGFQPAPRPPSVVPAAAAVAATAAAVALVAVEVVVLLAWATDGRARSGAGVALRVGAAVWLAGLHTRVHAGPAVVGLAPAGLTLLSVLLVARRTAVLARARTERGRVAGEATRTVATVAVTYGLLAAVLAAAVGSAQPAALRPGPPTALLGGTAVGAVGGIWGLLWARRAAGGALPLRALLPPWARGAVEGGVAAVAVLSAVAAILSAAVLALHAGAATGLTRALAPGLVGTVALLLLEVSLVPNVVICAAAWLAGPGVAVGTGTAVTPWGTHLGRVPALPLLSVLPSGPLGAGWVVLLVPLTAGAAGGLLAVRRLVAPAPLLAAGRAALAGPVAGLLGCVAAALAGGPAGRGRMLTVGPSAWRVGLALLVEVSVGAAAAAGAWAWLRPRIAARATRKPVST